MERYICTCHCGGAMFYKHLHDPSCDLFVHGEEAPQSKEAHLQAALDAERAAKEAHQSTVVDLRKELATLQAQLAEIEQILCIESGKTTADKVRDLHHSFKQVWNSYQSAVNELFDTQAQLRQVEGERDAALTPAAGGTRHGDTVRRVS